MNKYRLNGLRYARARVAWVRLLRVVATHRAKVSACAGRLEHEQRFAARKCNDERDALRAESVAKAQRSLFLARERLARAICASNALSREWNFQLGAFENVRSLTYTHRERAMQILRDHSGGREEGEVPGLPLSGHELLDVVTFAYSAGHASGAAMARARAKRARSRS